MFWRITGSSARLAGRLCSPSWLWVESSWCVSLFLANILGSPSHFLAVKVHLLYCPSQKVWKANRLYRVIMSPANFRGIELAMKPRTAAELCECVHCVAWMSAAIPRFARQSAPLYKNFKEKYFCAGRHTKNVISKLYLADLGWKNTHTEAFMDLQCQLENIVENAHPDPEMHLCVSSDASDACWAAVVAQCTDDTLRKVVCDQKHGLVAFLSSRFSTVQEHCTTYEEEAYAVGELLTFKRLDYLLGCADRVTVFTDHQNLPSTFYWTAVKPSPGRQKIFKVIRWDFYLSAFAYDINYFSGALNTMEDIMIRYMRRHRGSLPSTLRIVRIEQVCTGKLVPAVPMEESAWPNASTIRDARSVAATKPKSDEPMKKVLGQ